jgi:hypothetical protein
MDYGSEFANKMRGSLSPTPLSTGKIVTGTPPIDNRPNAGGPEPLRLALPGEQILVGNADSFQMAHFQQESANTMNTRFMCRSKQAGANRDNLGAIKGHL